MTLAFLIDECLTPELASAAHRAGYAAWSVRDRGWAGLKDHELVQRACEENLVMVTRNARDFRGSGPGGSGGLLRHAELHPGLICLDTEGPSFGLALQLRLFECALGELQGLLTNEALEVILEDDGSIVIERYEIP